MDYNKKFLKYKFKIHNLLLQHGGNMDNKFYNTHNNFINKKISIQNKIKRLNCQLNNKLSVSILKKEIALINKVINNLKNEIQNDSDIKINKISSISTKIENTKTQITKEPDNDFLNYLLKKYESDLFTIKNNNSNKNKLLDKNLKTLEKFNKLLDKEILNKKIIQEKITILNKELENFNINSREMNILFDNFKNISFQDELFSPKFENLDNFIYFVNSSFNNTVNASFGNFDNWYNLYFQLGYRYNCNELIEIFNYKTNTFKEIINLFEVPTSFIFNKSNKKVGKLPANKINSIYENKEFISNLVPKEIDQYLTDSKRIILDLNTVFPGNINNNDKYDLSTNYLYFRIFLSILNKINLEDTLFINFTPYISSFGAALINKSIDFKFHFPKEVFYTNNNLSIFNHLQDLNYSWQNKNITNFSSIGLVLSSDGYYNYDSDDSNLAINFDILPRKFNQIKKIVLFTEDDFSSTPNKFIYNSIISKYSKFQNYLNSIDIPINIYGIKENDSEKIIKFDYELKKK
jgi:hypothetical protein